MIKGDKEVCFDIIKRGWKNSFYYTLSGQVARDYVNLDEAILGDDDTWETGQQHEVIKQLGEIVLKEITNIEKEMPFDRIAFIDKAGQGPVGMIALSGLIMSNLKKEAIFVRPFRNTTRGSIRGRSLHDKDRILILSDVSTTGRTILKAAEKIWIHRAIVAGALVVFDNERGAKDNLFLKGIRLFSIIKREEAPEGVRKEIKLEKQKIEKIYEFGGVI
jgi:orotate phosphoribosyltransferase